MSYPSGVSVVFLAGFDEPFVESAAAGAAARRPVRAGDAFAGGAVTSMASASVTVLQSVLTTIRVRGPGVAVASGVTVRSTSVSGAGVIVNTVTEIPLPNVYVAFGSRFV